MLDEINPLQRWMQRQNAIPHPAIVELTIDHEVERLRQQSHVTHIELPLLPAPVVVTAVFAVLVPEMVTEDLAAWIYLDSYDLLTPIQLPPLELTDGGFSPLHTPEFTVNFVDISVDAPVDCLAPLLDEIPQIRDELLHTLTPPERLAVNLYDWPLISDDLLAGLEPPKTVGIKLVHKPLVSDDLYIRLTPPGSMEVKLVELMMAPAIKDILVSLKSPGKAGKSYIAKQAANFDLQPALPRLQDKRCRHGLPKAQCDICENSLRKAAPKIATAKALSLRTIDLFDLLLPYLQPPVGLLLANPLLFPAGQRPFDYQIEGIKFLTEHDAALLGDEMGLGKTIQTIVALQALYRQGKVRKALIVCPRSLLGTWERELNKWAPELYVLRVRGLREERAQLWKAPASIYLTNYETIRQDDGLFSARDKFQVIVLDEAQRIKNKETDIARAIHKIKAPIRWALSGTPLENKIEDVTSIFDYLKPSLFAHEWPGPETVKRKIAPYFLRRRTADVLQELPDKISNEIWLELTNAQRHAYDEMENAGREELGQPNATRIHVFALINRLKQICNLDPLSKSSCKLDYLSDQLGSIVESGQKALIFSHLPRVTLDQIKPQLDSFGAVVFDGRLSDVQREHIIHTFQNRESPSVLLMSVQAGGVGLTLTKASHVFHFDHWWNPAVARQAEGRAHRIGQERTVFVHDLFTGGTIEQRIHELLKRKQAMFDSVIDDLSAEYIQGKFSDDDLFGLFDLKAPVPTPRPQNVQKSASSHVSPQPTTQRSSTKSLATTVQTLPKRGEWHTVSNLEFENLVVELYGGMGYKIELTARSGDHGIDVIGRKRTNHGIEKIIIQCKHKPNGVVGEPEVCDLLDAWQEHKDARIAVLATNGTFSTAARSVSEKQAVLLLDRMDIERLYKYYMRNTV